MSPLGEHYLRQLAHVLALRLDATPYGYGDGRDLLLYRAMSVRIDECDAAGAGGQARALLAEARRQREEKVRRP